MDADFFALCFAVAVLFSAVIVAIAVCLCGFISQKRDTLLAEELYLKAKTERIKKQFLKFPN